MYDKKKLITINLMRNDTCTIISSKYGSTPEQLTNNLSLISFTMKYIVEHTHKETLESLEAKPQIVYIDSENTSERWIIFSILEELCKILPKNIFETLKKTIIQWSIFLDDETKTKINNTCNTSSLLTLYQTILIEHINKKPSTTKEQIKQAEFTTILECIEAILNFLGIQSIYVFLDQNSSLYVQDTKQINDIVFARGNIGTSKHRLLIKINNGDKSRKSFSTTGGNSIESPHDYSLQNI